MKFRAKTLGFHTLGTVLLAVGTALPAWADYQSTVLSQGPVGYYRLNETTQPQPPITTAVNSGSLGVNANGTYEGSQGFFRGFPGALANSDTAVHFDGSSQDVSVPFDPALNPAANFSVEGWLMADTAAANCALSCGYFGGPRFGWLIYQTANTGYEFRMYNGVNTSFTIDLIGNATNVVGVWTHVVATFDGTTARLYLNGVEATNGVPTAYAPAGSNGRFTVGVRPDAAFRWSGKADEVAFYGSVLTAGTVTAHYNAATANPGGYAALIQSSSPLLYLRLNEAGDPPAANLGTLGTSVNGAYASGSHPARPGPRPSAYPGFDSGNYAVSFDGTGGSVAIPGLNLNTNTVTMTGWINATGQQAKATGLIFSRTGATVAGLTIDAVGGGLALAYNWNNDPATYNWEPYSDGLPALPDSDWAFVALTVRPTQASIYVVDGVNFANFAGATNFTAHANQAFEGVTQVGADATTTYLNGAMDEVAIFNRALSTGEVYSQYAAAIGNVPPKVFYDPQTPADPLYTGDTLTLTVDAGGTPNLGYQWRKGGSPLLGATTSAYTKTGVDTVDNGTYDCIITNASGSATSGGAAITITPATPPAIVTGPKSRTLYPGATLNLSVVATGGGLKYQWQKDGTPIAGATASAYKINSVGTTNSGSYKVTVQNSLSSVDAGPVTITVLAPAAGYETAIVTDAPEAWFRLNETTGIDMLDSMGRHDGYYTNTDGGTPVTFGASGAVTSSSDTAVTFDGTSKSYGLVPYSPLLNGAAFTLECWAKTTDTTTTMCPVSSRSSVPQGHWFWTYPAGAWSGGIVDGGTTYYVGVATPSDGIVSGQWKHLVFVWSAGTGMRVYVNGQWDGSSFGDFDHNALAPMIIGARGGASPDVDEMFKGQVDEVLVYSKALSLAQAQNHYSLAAFSSPIPPYFISLPVSQEVVSNAAPVTLTGAADGPVPITYQWYKNGTAVAGATTTTLSLTATYANAGSFVLRASNVNGVTNSPPATLSVVPPNPSFVNVTNGLVLHLKFDSDYSDSSGRGNNGSPVGAPTLVPGRFGNALFLSTSNFIATNYVTLGKPADLNFGATTDFSVSYWVKTEPGQTNGDLPFLCSAVNSYGNPGLTFAPSYKEGGWSYSLNGAVQTYGGANTINDGNWHHLLHTFSRTGSAITYLDGVQADSRPCTSAGNLDTSNIVNVGQDPTGSYQEDGSATLDDLAVWRRALTQYEAYAIHYAATNSNSSFTVPGTVSLHIGQSGANVQITWQPGSTLGTLLQADSPNGPWTPAGAYTPAFTITPSATVKFYRLSLIE
jgi:hypothetical protein